ncbi:site-specific integrase [Flavobacteriaceae bacterium]|nr:site-specific integrase [Flavobacteriaceae bacterium]
MRFSARVLQSSKTIKSRNGREVRSQEGTIYVYTKIDGKKTQVKTHFTLADYSKFDAKSRQTTSKDDAWINLPLKTLLGSLKERYNKAITSKEIIDGKSLKRWVGELQAPTKPEQARYITDVTEDWIAKYPNKETAKTYRNLLSIFSKWEQGCEQRFRYIDLTESVLEDYKEWLTDGRYGPNTAHKRFAGLKTLIAMAKKHKEPVNGDYKDVDNPAKEETPTIVCSPEDLELIKQANDLPPFLENTRKWFLLGCNTGMRVGDLLEVKQEDFEWAEPVKDGEKGFWYIVYKQHKTKAVPTAPIADNWVVENVVMSKGYPHKISRTKYNEYIKELCKRAGITYEVKGNATSGKSNKKKIQLVPKYQLLASHTARRTFATISYDKRIPVSLIMRITGHKREADFFLYIDRKKTDLDTARAYMNYMV